MSSLRIWWRMIPQQRNLPNVLKWRIGLTNMILRNWWSCSAWSCGWRQNIRRLWQCGQFRRTWWWRTIWSCSVMYFRSQKSWEEYHSRMVTMLTLMWYGSNRRWRIKIYVMTHWHCYWMWQERLWRWLIRSMGYICWVEYREIMIGSDFSDWWWTR